MRILVLNGPNLNLLGLREPEIYGSKDFKALETHIRNAAQELQIEIQLFQSNHEGALVDQIQEAYGNFDGIIINPAAYTHTSVAIMDALKAVALPTIEVHLSDIRSRESFRQFSYVSLYATKSFCGLGFEGYTEGLKWLKEHLSDR